MDRKTLIAKLRRASEPSKYPEGVVDYWMGTEGLFALAADALEADSVNPDPMSQALNEGDGVYRP